MADEATPTPDPAPKTGEGTPAPQQKPTDEGKAPKWEGEFDQERASRLVANLRSDLEKAQADLKAAREAIAEKGKGEKTLQERLEALEKETADAKRSLLVARVAKECQVPDDLVEFLTAKDEEGLKKQAERLATHAKKAPADDVTGRPKPRLKNGAGEEADTTPFDPEKVAKAARDRY